jgi:hypothetical protein
MAYSLPVMADGSRHDSALASAAAGGRRLLLWTRSGYIRRGAGPVYSSSVNVSAAGSGEAGVPDLDGIERVMVTRERSAVVAAPRQMPILTVETT